MNKSFKKILSIVLSVMMISSFMTISLSVNAAEDGKVRVIVRNDTYSVENGAPWDGTLVDEWVSINDDSTMMSAVSEALSNHGYAQEGAENNYISSINGLAAFDGGTMSGWMGTLNDWFTNNGFAAYTVAAGTLESGDEIAIMYTSNGYGEDIGGSWANNDTTVKSVEITGAELSGEFDPSVTDYTLTIATPSADVNVVPTATNKNFQTRKYKNQYTPDVKNTDYKRSQSVTVSDGDKIIIGCGDTAWPSMNSSEGATVYTFTVKYAPSVADSVANKIDEVAKHLSSQAIPTVSSVGGEWTVIGLARADKITDEIANGYYNNAVKYVEEKGSAKLHNTKSTDNSRVILALTAIGKDVTNIASFNLLEPLADMDYVKKQGINGPIFALIALDSGDYEIPQTDATNKTTREKLVQTILDAQVANGGWTFFGSAADPDMTGMAIQALAPYYSTNSEVKEAVDKALTVMSNAQKDDGGFASWGSVNSESCAQILVALTSLGIDPTKDERFIKNGNTLIDAILSFSAENGFGHTDTTYNQMATEQSFYAFVSFDRLVNGKTSLYDMTDRIAANYKTGDVNLDGTVSVVDTTLVQKAVINLETLSKVSSIKADVNGDGVIDIVDATLIQKIVVNA